MTVNFASSEWAGQLAAAIDQSARVRTESVTWVHGPLVLLVEADEEHGFSATALRLDLHEGSCRSVDASPAEAVQRAPFAIAGPLARWRAVFSGEFSMVDGILDSKLRSKGDLPTLVRHRAMLDAIASAAGGIEAAWADQAEQPAGEPARA